MSKTIIFLLAISLSLCELRFAACPPTCRCSGIQSSKCTSCYEPFKDIETECIGCLPGYEYSLQAGKCLKLAEGACPSLCNCDDDGKCSECKDPNRNLTIGCAMCQRGFVFNFTEQQCYPLPCPKNCVCTPEDLQALKKKLAAQSSKTKKDEVTEEGET